MSKRAYLIASAGIFYFFFLLLTPLGLFNDWIPPVTQTGYYSVATIDSGDDAGYYAYLRSAFFDGDLDFANEHHYAHNKRFLPTGYVFNNWQLGQAVLYFPFFLAGHGLALLGAQLGYPVSVDGYSAPYYLSTAVASHTYLFVGLILLCHLLTNFFARRVAWVSAFALWLGSPLLYFTFIRSRMAHSVEFFVAVLLIWLWVQWRKSPNLLRHAVLGGVLGFLCTVRIINVAFFALYLVDQAVMRMTPVFPSTAQRAQTVFLRSSVFCGGFLLMMAPQLLAWHQLNGIPLPPRHLHFAKEGLSAFSLLPFLKNFFTLFADGRWGLIFSMPLAVAGLAGLFLRGGVLKELRPGLLCYVSGMFLIIVLYPEDSASYGHRHLIAALPVFALGLAAVLERCLQTPKIWRAAVGFLVLCVLAQFLMIVQYKVSLPYNHPRFTLEALGSIPQLILEAPEKLLRSTNWFRLMAQDHPGGWDYRDVLFLIVLPVIQLGVLAGVCWAATGSRGGLRLGGWMATPERSVGLIAGSSVVLMVIVGMTAPAMTLEEIHNRKLFQELDREGDALLMQGKAEEARARYLEASARMPGLWDPSFKVGETWQARGNPLEANRYYLKVLDQFPDHSRALFRLGDNLKQQGTLDEAERVLKSAIRAWPRNKWAYDSLAQVYMRQHHAEEARKMLLAAVTVDPDYGPGHANLAVVYSIMNQHEQAMAHLSRAIQLGVRSPVIDRLVALYQRSLGPRTP